MTKEMCQHFGKESTCKSRLFSLYYKPFYITFITKHIMFNFQGLTNSQIQVTDIKVMAASKVKLGQSALDFLKLNDDARRIVVDKDLTSGKLYIASVPVTKDDKGNVTSPGRSVSKDGVFGHQAISHTLGGQYSEWEIKKESGQEFQGITYYEIVETVNGERKRSEISGKETEQEKMDNIKANMLQNFDEVIEDDAVTTKVDTDLTTVGNF